MGEADDTLLWGAAFGENPGARVLPESPTVQGKWLRAVALGGQGWYSRARAELRAAQGAAAANEEGRRWLSLCLSAEASLVRQMGGHAAAAVLDGRALAVAVDSPSRCDALTGLAADALGRGRLRLAARLLERLDAELEANEEGLLPRQELRRCWVRAELALAHGDGNQAEPHAREAVRLAQRWTSARHQTKSKLIHAAALSAGGSADATRAAAALAEQCADEADATGLLPLAWAAAMLLVGIGASKVPGWEQRRDWYVQQLGRRGGIVG